MIGDNKENIFRIKGIIEHIQLYKGHDKVCLEGVYFRGGVGGVVS